MVAHALLTTYHVTRKRQAMGKQASTPAYDTAAGDDFPDDPF